MLPTLRQQFVLQGEHKRSKKNKLKNTLKKNKKKRENFARRIKRAGPHCPALWGLTATVNVS